MRYTNNAIFTEIRSAVLVEYPTVYCTQTYAPVPPRFPTVFAREIGRLTPPETATMSNAQGIYESSWEVQVLCNKPLGSKEQAYAIMDLVKSAMRRLYFVEYFQAPVDENNNEYTLAARFRRIIGSGESIPTN